MHSFLGQAPFQSARLFAETPPGVVMGLAWTSMGGATLFVEAQGRILSLYHTDDERNELSDEEDSDTEQQRNQNRDKDGSRGNVKSSIKRCHHSTNRPGQFRVTGQLGGVMNESCQIAMSFAKYFVSEFDSNNRYLDEVSNQPREIPFSNQQYMLPFLPQAQIHLHVPEGATPKDGPSAGITMATSLISLALNE